MRPARLGVVVALFGGCAVAAWAVLRAVFSQTGLLPPVPWTVPLALTVLALVVLGCAQDLRRRLRGDLRTRAYSPLAGARLLALAWAVIYAGAVLAGTYLGLAGILLSEREFFATARLVTTLLSSGAAVLVVLAGLVLERVCRVKPPEDPPGSATA